MLERTRLIRVAQLALVSFFLAWNARAGLYDGALDPSFWSDGTHDQGYPNFRELLVSPRGELIAVGNNFVEIAWFRLGDNELGSLCGFGITESTSLGAASFDSEGRLLIAGHVYFEDERRFQVWVVRYLYPACERDGTFGVNGLFVSDFPSPPGPVYTAIVINDIAADSTGRPVFVGRRRINDDSDAFAFRLTPLGHLDLDFHDDGVFALTGHGDREFTEVAIQADDRIVLAGLTVTDNPLHDVLVVRLDEAGEPDDTFDGDGAAIFDPNPVSWATSLLIEPGSGNLVVTAAGPGQSVALRIEPDGDLDPGFGDGGYFRSSIFPYETVHEVVRQSDGKLLLVGRAVFPDDDNQLFFVYRLLPTGGVDSSFGFFGVQMIDFVPAGDPSSEEIPYAAVLDGGKLVVSGYAWGDGSLEPSVAARLWIPLILADGFEGGDVSQWSQWLP